MATNLPSEIFPSLQPRINLVSTPPPSCVETTQQHSAISPQLSPHTTSHLRREEMASMAAATATPTVARPALVHNAAAAGASSSPLLALPQRGARGGRVRCSASEEKAAAPAVGLGASLLAAVSVMSVSSPALALVDERMSTEGTGLSLGVSNNLLGWILAGVFALIWALYFVYTSTLEEDEESGLSL